jgi:DNA topoisomerase II
MLDHLDDSINLSLSPVIQDYKQFLESMTVGISEDKGAFVKDFKEKHTDTSVYFVVTLAAEACPELLTDDAALMKRLKLEASLSTSNMHLFDRTGCITKYETPVAIMEAFYGERLALYDKRRAHLLQKMEREWRKMDNKVMILRM